MLFINTTGNRYSISSLFPFPRRFSHFESIQGIHKRIINGKLFHLGFSVLMKNGHILFKHMKKKKA